MVSFLRSQTLTGWLLAGWLAVRHLLAGWLARAGDASPYLLGAAAPAPALAFSGVPPRFRANVLVPTDAPLPRLTVRDAIGDLPDACHKASGRDGAMEYAGPPPSCFAAALRGGQTTVTDHCIWDLTAETLERCAAVPREGDAPPPGWRSWEGASRVTAHPSRPPRAGDWRDLPLKGLLHLLPEELRDPRKAADESTHGRFGRLRWDSQAATLLTNIALNSSTSSTRLHPSAGRPLTVREAARLQGIPDSMCFCGSVMDRYRQIGNSVPVPLAMALAQELRRSILAPRS